MPEALTRTPRKHRWYAHPLVSSILFAVIVLHASFQPNWGPRGGVTLVGAVSGAILGRSIGYSDPAFDTWYLSPSDSGWTVVDEERWITQSGAPGFKVPPGTIVAQRTPRTTRGGIWSVSWEVRRVSISFVPVSVRPAIAPATLASARAALFAELSSRGTSPSVIAQWQAGDQTHWRPLWTGIAQDILILLAFIFFIRSLTWVPEVLRPSKRHTHLCIHCTYDLRGLPPGPCPECGRTQDQA